MSVVVPGEGEQRSASAVPSTGVEEEAMFVEPERLATAELLVPWTPPTAEERVQTAPRPIGPWALGVAVCALLISLFVGWGIPLGIAGIVLGILAVRRRIESRVVAAWAIVLSAVSMLYSLAWLAWAAFSSGWFGG